MMNMKRLPLFVFLLSSVVEVASQIFGLTESHFIAKPLIMLGLMGHYYFQSPNRSFLFVMALYFMLGLGAFLIGHLLYILCYRHFRWAEKANELLRPQKVRFSFPIVLAGTGLVVILYPSLGDLKIPVLIYALVLTLMALNALFRYGRTTTKSFLFVFMGAVLFMLSDSLLAINKFYASFSSAGAMIMMTYCTAQFLIVEGISLHEKNVSRQ
jgi:uncharacterized membrane protein YhhN